MQTKLNLTQGSDSTVRIHILDEADSAFSLSDFESAKFTIRDSIDGDALIEKTFSASTTTTSVPELHIRSTYVEIIINASDTEDLDLGSYVSDITFTNANGKEFTTDLFYTQICPKVSQ